MKTRFTLIDVLAIAVIVIFLGVLFLSSRIGPRGDVAHTIRCASNLRQIGEALLMYGNSNNGNYPRTRWDQNLARWNSFTNPSASNPFADDGPKVNDVTAALYLLVRTQGVPPQVFTCPNSDATLEPGAAYLTASNFTSPGHLSYGYTNPYPTAAAISAGWKLNTSVGAEFAVAADKSSGGPVLPTLSSRASLTETRRANSPKHRGDGQNVLYGDGHVDWNITPFCGVAKDNIYAFGPPPDMVTQSIESGIVGSSTGPSDSVILPSGVWDAHLAALDARTHEEFVKNITYVAGSFAWYGSVAAALFWFTWWRWGNLRRRLTRRTPSGKTGKRVFD